MADQTQETPLVQLNSIEEKLGRGAEALTEAEKAIVLGLIAGKRAELLAQAVVEPTAPETALSPEKQTLNALKVTFDETATKLQHGLSWENIQASLEQDQEAIIILGDLIARGGRPTVTADENGEIMWDEACSNVPLEDFKGIPMNNLAYDAAGQAKALKECGCRGNAVDSASHIHSRVKLTSKVRVEKLIAAGLVKDTSSFPWLATPDAERGNKNDRYAGRAWYGSHGRVD